MHCTVLLFAQLAEALDTRELSIDLPDDATAGDALAVLAGEHTCIERMRKRLALAVDDAYVTAGTKLREGQRIALIPPVSGG